MTKNVAAKTWPALYLWSDGSSRSYPPAPTPPSSGVPFPRTAGLGTSGDANGNQSYPSVPYSGQVTGKVISSSGYFQESAYSNPVPWFGRFDIAIAGGNYEQQDASGTYDRGTLFDTIQQIQYATGFNPTQVWLYNNYEERLTNNGNAPYNSFFPTVDTEKWGLYGAANQAGSPVTDSFGGGYSTNWAVAWPGTVNGVAADQQISPGRTTAHYDGNPEDLTQCAAAYFIEVFTARHSSFTGVVCGTIPASAYTDPRWYPTLVTGSNNDAMKAPQMAAIFTDNLFCVPETAGYYDLANNYPAYGGYTSATIPWLLRGAQHFKARYQAILSLCYPGRTYLNVGNIAQFLEAYWVNKSTFSTLANGLSGYLQGGLIEAAIGPSYSFDTTYGTDATIQSYQAVMDFCSAPKAAILHGYPTSSTDYQTARYTLGVTLMDDGYCGLSIAGDYRISGQMYLDEFGGNPGTNIPKGWLGTRVGNRPVAAGVNGVWIAYFTNGVYLLNPRGNGTQTITAAQINAYLGTSHTFAYFFGLQDSTLNSGAAMTSASIPAADGLALRITS